MFKASDLEAEVVTSNLSWASEIFLIFPNEDFFFLPNNRKLNQTSFGFFFIKLAVKKLSCSIGYVLASPFERT